MSQSKRIRYLLHELELTQSEFAAAVGISQSAVSMMVSEKTAMSMHTLQSISNTYNVDCNWLVKGVGEPFPKPASNVASVAVTVDAHGNKNISLVPAKAQGRYGTHHVEPSYIRELPSFQVPVPAFQEETLRAFEMDSDSMEPTLFKGDLLICRIVEDWRRLREMELYVVVVQGDVLVKRVQNRLRQEDRLILISDNRFYPPIEVASGEVVEVWSLLSRLTSQIKSAE